MVFKPAAAHLVAEQAIKAGMAVHQGLLDNFLPEITQMAQLVLETFQKGGRIVLVGNGGSAAQAQHVATEFVVRFHCERPSLPAIALTADTSVLTAAGNDFGFDQIFSRQVEGLVSSRDLLVALSTSGSSENILAAARQAKQQKATTVAFTGNRKGPLVDLVDFAFEVPSDDTQRIQEAHLLIWHIICQVVDTAVAEDGSVTTRK